MLRTTNRKKDHLLRLFLNSTLIVFGLVSQLESARAIPEMMRTMMSNKFKSADKNADGELRVQKLRLEECLIEF